VLVLRIGRVNGVKQLDADGGADETTDFMPIFIKSASVSVRVQAR
jgi:hypothetical protein